MDQWHGSERLMEMLGTIEDARRWYAEDLRAAAPVVRCPAVVEAFAAVPRERFLGSGPWRLHPRRWEAPPHTSATDDPRELCHDVLVSIDEGRDLNNGQPSLWAFVFDQLGIAPGETVLQVGAGVGYFTAILAELVGPEGRVIAYEVEEALARRAAEALADRPQVEVVAEDATEARDLPRLDVVVAAAGVTHAPEAWRSRLVPGGRMMLPFTGEDWKGFLLLLHRDGERLRAASLGPCGFYPCHGARHADEAAALAQALRASDGKAPPLAELRWGAPTPGDASAWYAGQGFWLSRE